MSYKSILLPAHYYTTSCTEVPKTPNHMPKAAFVSDIYPALNDLSSQNISLILAFLSVQLLSGSCHNNKLQPENIYSEVYSKHFSPFSHGTFCWFEKSAVRHPSVIPVFGQNKIRRHVPLHGICHAGLKTVLADFNTIWARMETSGWLEGRKNTLKDSNHWSVLENGWRWCGVFQINGLKHVKPPVSEF